MQGEIFGPFVAALNARDGRIDGRVGAGFDRLALDDEQGVALWATMHGFVMLEINNHLPFVDDRARIFDERCADSSRTDPIAGLGRRTEAGVGPRLAVTSQR